ncbi:MAG: phosphoglycerate kinase [Alphaproteobacteria bacterium]|nr:phosphoglycerate kinase [Alphaproteobacteria bacterium]
MTLSGYVVRGMIFDRLRTRNVEVDRALRHDINLALAPIEDRLSRSPKVVTLGPEDRTRILEANRAELDAVKAWLTPEDCAALERDFAQGLAKLGDFFVNDAFSAAHRAHASTTILAYLLPSAAGRSMQAELEHLHKALADPERPLMAVVGGAKISTKIALLENLVARVETLVIGGAMANTFLAAQGIAIGKSLCENDQIETAARILHKATETGAVLLLPTDVVVAKEFKAGAAHRTVDVHKVGAEDMILDVGPATIAEFEKRLHTTRTLVWNGPFGAFETAPFDAGTVAAAKLVAQRTKSGDLLSVAGGGDTVAALNHAGVADDFTYVSTAGGAFLEWLEGQELPGVAALMESKGS